MCGNSLVKTTKKKAKVTILFLTEYDGTVPPHHHSSTAPFIVTIVGSSINYQLFIIVLFLLVIIITGPYPISSWNLFLSSSEVPPHPTLP